MSSHPLPRTAPALFSHGMSARKVVVHEEGVAETLLMDLADSRS
jgi:hypothetical protein